MENKTILIKSIAVGTLPEGYYKNPTIVFGLGEDNNAYFWNEDSGEWQLNVNDNYNKNN